jgi:penicillin-binding protein 1A
MPVPRRLGHQPIPYRRRRPRWHYVLLAVLSLLGLGAGAVAGALWYVAKDIPSLDSLQEYQPSLVTQVYSDDRQVVGQFYVERRILTPLTEIPASLKNAVIAVEDSRFFEHPGLDIIGILRATWTNLRRGERREGASTITQQLARSLFLSSERTYTRKLRELVLAYKMELILSKEQILEMYLNQIYFGQGAYGVGSAAQTYFGKELSELTLAESALLAGLPKSPNNYSPYKHFERAKKRQEHVLSRMEEEQFITAEEREAAAAQEIVLRHPGAEQLAPHFMEYIRQHLMARYGETMVYKGGLEVSTTLNAEWQQVAERAIRTGLRQLDKRQGWRGPIGTQDPAAFAAASAAAPPSEMKPGDLLKGVVSKVGKDAFVVVASGREGTLSFEDMAWAKRRLRGRDPSKDYVFSPNVKTLLKPGDVIEVEVKKIEKDVPHFLLEQTPLVEGALVALDPRTGAIKAMVGGFDFARSEYNRAVLAHRQSGSAFKPIIYATALNKGLSPSTLLLDAPVVYEQQEKDKTWKPENYEKKFYGPISMREALTHSRNLATVRLLEQVGIPSVIEFAQSLGITSPLNRDLSLALGSSSVTLMELTSAFGIFANQGTHAEPFAINQVQDSNGQNLEQAAPNTRPAVSKEIAFLLTNMLEDVIQRGTGIRAKGLGRPVAGKTGTTNDYTDAWFIGYTPNLVVGVWVGFDDIRSLGEAESGSHAALPIWIEFMHEAFKTLPVMQFEVPDDIEYVRVDSTTGLLASEAEEHGTVELFTKGTGPKEAVATPIDPMDFYKLDQPLETKIEAEAK